MVVVDINFFMYAPVFSVSISILLIVNAVSSLQIKFFCYFFLTETTFISQSKSFSVVGNMCQYIYDNYICSHSVTDVWVWWFSVSSGFFWVYTHILWLLSCEYYKCFFFLVHIQFFVRIIKMLYEYYQNWHRINIDPFFLWAS